MNIQNAKRYKAFRYILAGHEELSSILEEECNAMDEPGRSPLEALLPSQVDAIMDNVISRGEAECNLVF